MYVFNITDEKDSETLGIFMAHEEAETVFTIASFG